MKNKRVGKKLDLSWKFYSLILVSVLSLSVIGFTYAYGGANPSISGHSAGEMMITIEGVEMTLQDALDSGILVTGEVSANDVAVEIDGNTYSIQQAIDMGLIGGGEVSYLYNEVHTEQECIDLGGNAETVDTGIVVCRTPGSSCPSEWTSYGSWRSTSSRSCSGATGCSCTTSSHTWSTASVETCTYYTKLAAYTGNCAATSSQTCTAYISEIGCY